MSLLKGVVSVGKTEKPPTIPYVEAHWRGGKQKPSAIVLRSSFTTPEKGAALGMATYWNTPLSPHDISHYIIDEAQIIQTVPDVQIAGHWHSQTRGAIRVTLCAEPMALEEFWDDSAHSKVLANTAKLIAELVEKYGIRLQYLNSDEIQKWAKRPSRRKGGLIIEVRGSWPANEFLSDAQANLLQRR